MSVDATEVKPQALVERATELAAWCDLDPPTTRDVECSLRRDRDQVCWVGPGGAGALIVVPRWGSASVKYLAVPAALRGRGIGGGLLASVEAWA
ncbi:MAG TPA: hypothetical protein VLL25_08060, partial [Acidimicrobiales bacterium]|nr:hypothetical protein [Acidimicrobiales bacterium]